MLVALDHRTAREYGFGARSQYRDSYHQLGFELFGPEVMLETTSG